MSRIYVHAYGAVSPAGWGVPPLIAALAAGTPLPTQDLPRPNRRPPLPTRAVPTANPRPACLNHPRLRRAGAISHFAVAAAVEALPPASIGSGDRLGIVVGTHVGSIRYSERFYSEVRRDPASASPLLFPETVLNAPTSHVAAGYPPAPLSTTVIGDETAFLQALALGANWLLEDHVDQCLVLSAEELDWVIGDALQLVDHRTATSEGAGALWLNRRPPASTGVELNLITAQHAFTRRRDRLAGAQAVRRDLGDAGDVIYDSRTGHPPSDRAEETAWADERTRRISPRRVLGQAFAAASAWQCLAACHAIAQGEARTATVSVVGSNQAALGARFQEVPAQFPSPKP